ncbi:MAG TPA: uroporphyrinogen-III synthase [Saprospiraceae bacterium]|nr:uroporphyrinogen-III synthase [Saprospiraceae bacterium]HNG90849.1 uroporphyrinogen-III synthase [Saprospiraceae bacterium]
MRSPQHALLKPMPSAFISRTLSPDSDFRRRLEAVGWQVSGQSLVEISPLPFGTVPPCDWIFFSSQNGVQHFFEQAERAEGWTFQRRRHTRWAALGPATARRLQQAVDRVHFIGTGEPLSTAAAFAEGGGSGVVLLAAAQQTEGSLLEALRAHTHCLHLPVYDNRPLPEVAARPDDVLVFSSPMNAGAYFAHHALLPGQQVVSIGPSTAAALARLGIGPGHMAAQPTEAGMAEAALHARP